MGIRSPSSSASQLQDEGSSSSAKEQQCQPSQGHGQLSTGPGGCGDAVLPPWPLRGGEEGRVVTSLPPENTLWEKTEREMKAQAGWAQLGPLEVEWDRRVPHRLAASEALGPRWARLPGAYLTVCFHRLSVRRERDHTAAERPGNLRGRAFPAPFPLPSPLYAVGYGGRMALHRLQPCEITPCN